MIPTLEISAVQMLGLAACGVAAGTWLKRRLPLLDRLNIPTPVVGGMLYAVTALVLRYASVNVEADVGFAIC
jgi:ESS family glutamate:Na+ symporter